MTADTEQTKPRRRLWLRLLLAGSLALNLLVLGLVVGAVFRFHGPQGMRPPPPQLSIGAALVRELPTKDRRALRANANDAHGERHARQQAEALAVGAALRAVPYDGDAVAALLTSHATQRQAFTRSVQQAWLTRVNAMSPDERQAYADRLEKALTAPRFTRNRRTWRHD